jgi:hypothetical protein
MSKEEPINYIVEMLKHEAVITSGLISVILGFLLSMMVGVTGFFAPPLLFLTMIALATLFIPSSPVFQDGVNRKVKQEEMEKNRTFLLSKLVKTSLDNYGYKRKEWNSNGVRKKYVEMMGELEALQEIAGNDQSSISSRDLENLEDASVNFLRMAYALQHINTRSVKDSTKQIDKLDFQIANATGIDKRKLQSIRSDLASNQSQRDRIPAKKAAIEAQMESIYQAFSDIHYQVVANPGDAGAVNFLREATSRLQIEEEIAMDTDLELSGAGSDNERLRKAKARIAQKAKERS